MKTTQELKEELTNLGHEVQRCNLDASKFVPMYWCKKCKFIFYYADSIPLCRDHGSQSVEEAAEDVVNLHVYFEGKFITCKETIIRAVLK